MKLANKYLSMNEAKEMSQKEMGTYLEKKFLPALVKAAKKNKVPTFLPWRFEVTGGDEGSLDITFEVGAGKGFLDFGSDKSFNNEDGKKVSEKQMIDELIGAGQEWRTKADDKEKAKEDKRNSIPFTTQFELEG